MYCAVPVTWLAMATLFIDRTSHFWLGVGLAVGLWLLADQVQPGGNGYRLNRRARSR